MAPSRSTTAAPTLVLEFDFEKDTKNTLRFQEADVENGHRAAVGTLYITKAALNEVALGDTRRIRVTIESAEA